MVPAICSNDEIFELQAVLAGKVLGQLAGVTAAPFVRDGRLVPVLTEHMPEYAGYFVYFGSRTSQPARARAFIDLAVQRLTDNPEYLIQMRAWGDQVSAPQLTAAQEALDMDGA